MWRLLLHTVRNEWKKMNRTHPGRWGAAASVSWLCSYWKRSVRHAFGYYIYYIVFFFCFFVLFRRKKGKFTTHGALCVYFLRVFFLFRFFFINLFFRILLFLFEKRRFLRCQSNIRKESPGLILMPLLSLRSLTYSSGSFFFFSNDGRKKNSDWMKTIKFLVPSRDSRHFSSFSSDSVVVERRA